MTAALTQSRPTDISREHLLALRKLVRKQAEKPPVRMLTCSCEDTEEQFNVLRIAEPAGEGHPAGVWEVGSADATTIRVWWMPDGELTDINANGALMAIKSASVIHPERFAESVVAAIVKARQQRKFKVWRAPEGM